METLGPQVERLILRHLAQQQACSFATVVSYDAQTHRARVRLQPDGTHTGSLPLLVAHAGYLPPLQPGQQCLVLCVQGHPVAIAGCVLTDTHPLPEAALALDGDAHILGDLIVYGRTSVAEGDVLGALFWMQV